MAVNDRVPADSILETIGKGRAFRPDVDEALARLFGTPAGREGLSRIYQPSFPGLRTFLIQARVDHVGAVELCLVGIGRDGGPLWVSQRAFHRGLGGALEIFHGRDDISSIVRSRNITTDTLKAERSLLTSLSGEESARICLDATGPARYLCAIHGFVFADETEDGASLRSARPFDSSSDRLRLKEAAGRFTNRVLRKHACEEGARDRLEQQIEQVRFPHHFAELSLELPLPFPDSERDFASAFGRAFLLGEECPSWRAALYPRPIDLETDSVGRRYRELRSSRAHLRLEEEIERARGALTHPQRAVRIAALETLGRIAGPAVLSEIRQVAEGPDRRVAAAARQVLKQISGAELQERILAFATRRENDGERRGLAFRVLAEYYPSLLSSHVAMLRVDPDARLQRAVIPVLAQHEEAGPELAAMLAANPWSEASPSRPGLLDLRLELIERLGELSDPRTLLVLSSALSAHPPPPAEETLALSRILIAHPDPRARIALAAASRAVDRPPVP